MAKPKEPVNPFYALLVVACAAFLLTILMYLTSLLQQARSSPLARFLDESGPPILYGEVALIAVAGIAAMVLDRIRSRRRQRADSPPQEDVAAAAPPEDDNARKGDS